MLRVMVQPEQLREHRRRRAPDIGCGAALCND